MSGASIDAAFEGLADLAAAIDVAEAPEALITTVSKTLLDTFGVGIAGTRTPEFRALLAASELPPGQSAIWGSAVRVDGHSATLLNGTALCSLELDEGNKAARGHPGAHVIPAAVAEAERIDASTSALLSAVLAGYEVATRVATAFRPAPGLHPHGHWGAIGAAVAVGRLHGFSRGQLLQAMDAAAGLVLATPFSSALDGSYVRNTWAGAAGANGITAARLVSAGLGSHDATARSSLGELLGTLDSAAILSGLGDPWTIDRGYFKRHSCCAYTHPPADAAIEIRRRHPELRLDDITRIDVETHSLAAPLDRAAPATRLAAMFSIPHVVGVALRDGACRPEGFGEDARNDRSLARVRDLTTVSASADLDAGLPAHRGARLTLTLASGQVLRAEVPDAIGDGDYFPFDFSGIAAKISDLIGVESANLLVDIVERLPASPNSARADLAPMSELQRESAA